jgi:glyoxylase-like metal-dependent hydrolase (beta-lactamase superfamily II)
MSLEVLAFPNVSELSWWFAPHPDWEPSEDWPEEVPVVLYETDDEVAVIDPFLPPDGTFDPHGKPVWVLLTQPSHYRGTTDFVVGYEASVWVPPHAIWKRPDVRISELSESARTDALPSGVHAIELDGEPQQVAFFIRDHETLVSGDVLSGTGGRLHVFVDEADPERLLRSLNRLSDLPIDRVIIPHGDAIFSDGAARIRAAVAEARRG